MNAITFQWSKRDLWPSRLGMTFFAHAVELVGQAISTERLNRPKVPHEMPHPPWQSNQLIGNSVHHELPIDSTRAEYFEKLVAKTLLAEFAPEQGEPEFIPATDHLQDDYEFTDDQWSAAHYYSTLRLPHPNVREVARAFGIVGSLGVIKARWVAQDGRLLDINPEIWSESLAVMSWIGLCQVAQEDVEYFDDDFHTVNHWIFLDSKDFIRIDPSIWFEAGQIGKGTRAKIAALLKLTSRELGREFLPAAAQAIKRECERHSWPLPSKEVTTTLIEKAIDEEGFTGKKRLNRTELSNLGWDLKPGPRKGPRFKEPERTERDAALEIVVRQLIKRDFI